MSCCGEDPGYGSHVPGQETLDSAQILSAASTTPGSCSTVLAQVSLSPLVKLLLSECENAGGGGEEVSLKSVWGSESSYVNQSWSVSSINPLSHIELLV